MKLLTVHELVNDCLSMIGDDDRQYEARFVRFVSRACKSMGRKYAPRIRTEQFALNEALVIALPEYTVAPIKVGKVWGDRRTIGLYLITDVYSDSEVSGCVCSSESSSNGDVVCPVHTFHNCCWYSGGYGELYGWGQQEFIGKVEWRPNENHLIFDSYNTDPGDIITVEYELTEDDQAYCVPEVFQDAVIQRCLQWFYHNRNMSASREAERRFVIELNEAKKDLDHTTYDQLIMAFRGGFKAGVKR